MAPCVVAPAAKLKGYCEEKGRRKHLPFLLLFLAFSLVGVACAEECSYVYDKTINNVWTKTDWTLLSTDELLSYEFKSNGKRASNIHLDSNNVLMQIGDAAISLHVNTNGYVEVRSTTVISGLSMTRAEAQVVSTKTNYSDLDDALIAANGNEVKVLSDAELSDAHDATITLSIASGLKVVINKAVEINKLIGEGKVFSAEEPSESLISSLEDSQWTGKFVNVAPSEDWLLHYYPEGNKNGADIGANGVALWKSYCLGLDPTNALSRPVLTIVASPSQDTLKIFAINVKPVQLEGLTITPKLLEGDLGGIFTEVTDNSASVCDSGFEVRISPDQSAKFYKIKYEFD